MHHKVTKVLKELANGSTVGYSVRQRANIVLEAVAGVIDLEIAFIYDVSRNVVARWRRRFLDALPRLNRIAQKRPEALNTAVQSVLSDHSRSGRPPLFDAVSRSFIIGIACNNPNDYGYLRSHL